MPGFIPPFELGTFKPSAASLASWLYEIWQYLQQNPIPNDAEITEKVTEIVPPEVAAYMQEHPATVQSVNGLIGAVVIAYADLVSGSTVPVFRTTTIESTQADLLDAWDEGCRFTVIDDTNVYVMLYSELGGVRTITLLPCGSGGGGGGIQSINTTVLPDGTGNAVLTSQDIPLSTLDPTTVSTQLSNMVTAINGKASQNDLNTLSSTVSGKADKTAFTGATSGDAGAMGLVPAPDIGEQGHYLTGDGNWTAPPLIYVNISYGNVGAINAGNAKYMAIDPTKIPDGYTPVGLVSSYFTFSGGTPFISGLCDTAGDGSAWFFRIFATTGAGTSITNCTVRLWLAKL